MRWVLLALCALVGAALSLYPLTLVETQAQVVVPAAAAAALFGVAAVFGLWRFAGAAAMLVIAEYTIALIIGDGEVDVAAVGLGVGLFVQLELVDLARQTARKATVHRDVVRARGRFTASVGLAGLAAGGGALIAGALATGGHAISLVVGAAAALATVWLTVSLARRAVLEP